MKSKSIIKYGTRPTTRLAALMLLFFLSACGGGGGGGSSTPVMGITDYVSMSNAILFLFYI